LAEARIFGDPRALVREFLSREYREIGRREIDGSPAEGIEIRDPALGAGKFETSIVRLWVDADTGWPVEIEQEATLAAGTMRMRSVFHDFDWNVALDPALFEIVIPDGYRLEASLGEAAPEEEAAIAGLRGYAELVGGRFPTALAVETALAEADIYLGANPPPGPPTRELLEKLMSIRNACAFWKELVDTRRDPVYHGDRVRSGDSDRALLRWRLDDGRYRVVLGDLSARTVTNDELASLED
jgi:hypothetical protein